MAETQTQTQDIMELADQIGQLLNKHPAIERYKSAQKAVGEDAEAGRLLAEFERTMETLDRQAQSGMPPTDAQRQQIEAMQSRIISHLKIKNLNMAQVDFVDLLRKINQRIQAPLAEGIGAPAGTGAAPRVTR